MVCSHLKELYQLCETNDLRLGSSDLIRIVCRQCNQQETCPSVLMDEYDSHEAHKQSEQLPVSDESSDPPSS
ncbi:MAG: hypothetical protein RIK87_06820 [Fuerstiella sp.]